MPSPKFSEVAMDSDDPVVGHYFFQEVEYVISVWPQEETLTIEIEDKVTADQWRASFDPAYIEDLTHKTGNFKQFSVFVSMLISAVNQSSESVSLDLLTYSDLEVLRTKKAGVTSRSYPTAPTSNGLNSKRYLILTYTVEFDRIHYPLPLPYVGKPDPTALQETIRQLREEISSLKCMNNKKGIHREYNKLQQEFEQLLHEKEEVEAAFHEYRAEMESSHQGASAKEVRLLKKMMKSLEEDLLKERTKNQRASSRRSQDFRELMSELEEVRASERNLKARVRSLTNELAVYRRKGSRVLPNTSKVSSRRNTSGNSSSHRNRSGLSSRENSLNRNSSSRENSFSRDRSSDRSNSRISYRDNSRNNSKLSSASRDKSIERSWRSNRSRDSKHSRDRSSSRERSLSQDRTRILQRPNVRSRSPSPVGGARFDPTAYTREKQRKQREAELKLKRQRRPGRPPMREKKPPPCGQASYPRPRSLSRTSSVNSLKSVASSIESLSDIPVASDSSLNNGPMRNGMKPGKNEAWTNEPGQKTYGKPKQMLSSTPEAAMRTKSRLTKPNPKPEKVSENFDQSSELADIDARLSRLQEFMQANLALT